MLKELLFHNAKFGRCEPFSLDLLLSQRYKISKLEGDNYINDLQ